MLTPKTQLVQSSRTNGVHLTGNSPKGRLSANERVIESYLGR